MGICGDAAALPIGIGEQLKLFHFLLTLFCCSFSSVQGENSTVLLLTGGLGTEAVRTLEGIFVVLDVGLCLLLASMFIFSLRNSWPSQLMMKSVQVCPTPLKALGSRPAMAVGGGGGGG